MTSHSLILVSAGSLAALPTLSLAQPFDISWSVLASGGATADASGPYTLGGSIGQPAASQVVAGPYQLRAGFWPAAASGPTSCYPNCDQSTGSPLLTANDFQCFLNKYAAGDTYANCDGSTGTPILTANDFQCFLNKFAAGCS